MLFVLTSGDSMTKMLLLGIPGGAESLTDCTANMLEGALRGGLESLGLPFSFPFPFATL